MVDPISVGVGTVATALVKGRKKKTGKDEPGVIKAVLLPPATVIGNELALRLQDMFARGREKRVENLTAHVTRADAMLGSEELHKVAEEPAFAEWAEGVSKVDPKDEDLAAIWQAALLALKEGGLQRLRVLTIAKTMPPDEAAAFLQCIRWLLDADAETVAREVKARRLPWNTLAVPREYVGSLRRRGLLESFWSRLFRLFSGPLWIIPATGAAFVVLLAIGAATAPFMKQPETVRNASPLLVPGVAALAALLALTLASASDTWLLTEDGYELARLARRALAVRGPAGG